MFQLLDQNTHRMARKGEVAGKRFVEHDPDGVPITRRTWSTVALLWCHVGDRSPKSLFDRLDGVLRKDVRHESEVEHHHSTGVRHQHIARLQVPVNLACPMERRDARNELPEGVAQARFVEPSTRVGGGVSTG